MGTKQNPGTYDCYHKAADDEPMFILLARDPLAPGLVETWADQRMMQDAAAGIVGSAKVDEAKACAASMRKWLASKGQMAAPRPLFEIPSWNEDDDQFDPETGRPGIMQFANAIQMWAWAQNRSSVTVLEAAAAFNCDPRRVVEAVEEHPWMGVYGWDGDDMTTGRIEHDGE